MLTRSAILRGLTVAMLVPAVIACGLRAPSPAQTPASLGSRYILNEVDLTRAGSSSLGDVVRRLRPEWTRINPTLRQPSAPQQASVYLEQSYLGGLDVLALVQASEAGSVEYLTPMAARGRFGAACPCAAGVIVIRKRDGP